MKTDATNLLHKLLSDYGAKRSRDNWRGTVFARFVFDERGVHLEHWSVDLPRTDEGISVRRYGESQ